jgi:hypothetical protein
MTAPAHFFKPSVGSANRRLPDLYQTNKFMSPNDRKAT